MFLHIAACNVPQGNSSDQQVQHPPWIRDCKGEIPSLVRPVMPIPDPAVEGPRRPPPPPIFTLAAACNTILRFRLQRAPLPFSPSPTPLYIKEDGSICNDWYADDSNTPFHPGLQANTWVDISTICIWKVNLFQNWLCHLF